MKVFILKSAAFCLLAFSLACSKKELPTQATPASETWVAYPDFQLLDPDGKSYKLSAYKGEVGRAYQVNAIPHNVIIDKEFKIRFTQTGYGGNLNDLIAKIESLL